MFTFSKRSHFNISRCISQCCSYLSIQNTRLSSGMLYMVKCTYVYAFLYVIFPTICTLYAQPFAPRNLLQAVLLQACLREVTYSNFGQEAEYPTCCILWVPQDSNFFTSEDDPTVSRQPAHSFTYYLSLIWRYVEWNTKSLPTVETSKQNGQRFALQHLISAVPVGWGTDLSSLVTFINMLIIVSTGQTSKLGHTPS
jgi:hypothetical protein